MAAREPVAARRTLSDDKGPSACRRPRQLARRSAGTSGRRAASSWLASFSDRLVGERGVNEERLNRDAPCAASHPETIAGSGRPQQAGRDRRRRRERRDQDRQGLHAHQFRDHRHVSPEARS